MSDSLGLSLPLVQASIDSFLGMTLVQTLLTGVYLVIFWNAIGEGVIRQFLTLKLMSSIDAVPLVKDGRHKLYTGVLILLFTMVITSLAAQWKITRSVFVVHDESLDTITVDLLTGSVTLSIAENAFECIAIVVADSLVCWRCYTLWQKNKWMLGAFIIVLLGEVALIPLLLALSVRVGPAQVSLVSIFLFTSTGVTVVATALIIYRIIDVSRYSTGQATSQYQYIIEILVESGIMYSTTLLITGVLLAVGGNINVPNHSIALIQVTSYWNGISTPVTGIAPTLIALRISTGTARDARQWEKPMTGVSFHWRQTGEDVVLSTLNSGTRVAVGKVSTTDVESGGESLYATKVSV